MNYKETLSFLFSQLPMYQREGKAAYKSDLYNTIELDRYFDFPHKKFKTIHIAGTNGKGSVSHILASILQEQGYKTGLYTSPHLKDFRERIRINGKFIQKEFVVDFVKNHTDIIKKLSPSFFELTVAMAFDFFAKQKVEIAVIETGMGGRLDSTNIINPEISVITNIGLDHTTFLGNTIEEIATEKAGIIKQAVPVVVGEYQKETVNIFLDKTNKTNSEIYFADKSFKIEYTLTSYDNCQLFNVLDSENNIAYKNLKTDLLGNYQTKNTITVLKTLDVLNKNKLKISVDSIYSGFKNVIKNTGFSGRWQILGNNPLIVCDTAHNKEGISFVINQINNTAYKNLHMVFGVVNDKNVNEILELLPKKAYYYFTKANIPRALNETLLYEKAKVKKLKGKVFKTVQDAFNAAKLTAKDNDMIFIGGSTFVVAEIV